MIVAFASNFLNHHQLPLALAFNEMEGIEYYFLAFSKTPQSRIDVGYEEMNDKYSFVIKAYESVEAEKRAIEIIKKADIFISGWIDKYTRMRLKEGKRVYKFSERFFKTYGKRTSTVHFFLSAMKHMFPFRKKDVVYLAASAFLKNDLNRFFKCRNTVLRWGYFPECTKETDENQSVGASALRILFVGRLLNLKHPELALYAFASLPSDVRDNAVLTFVGDGPMRMEMVNLTKKLELTDNVVFEGAMAYQKVRNLMKNSDIFLFMSDFSEGWGAVLNEAMDSKCACIATKEAGSSKFLIVDGENGFLCSCFDQKGINERLYELVTDRQLRLKLQNNAYLTIERQWNAKEAAKRLIDFDGGKRFAEGICSEE